MESVSKLLKRVGLLAAILISALGTQSALAAISGSAHDFSAKGWGSTQLCIFCHAPHNSASTTLLWNHAPTTATYTLYSSGTMNALLGQPAVGTVSKLCLSCHDGTVAVDNFGGRTPTPVTIAASANLAGGTVGGTTGSLVNDHPISFAYTTALATTDGGLVSPASLSLVSTGVPLYGNSGQLECASCHDVHNNTTGTPAKLLRVANTGSALCLKCHVK